MRTSAVGCARPRAWLLALVVACTQGRHDDPPESPDVHADSGPSEAGARDGGNTRCSAELCKPYTCEPRWDVCRTACSAPEHCISGFVCEAGFCIGTECTEATARERCGPYACVRGLCAPTCSSSGCADGYYCRADTLECVLRCRSRQDPVCNGFVCDVDVGECEPYCRDGVLECAAGFECSVDGQCIASH